MQFKYDYSHNLCFSFKDTDHPLKIYITFYFFDFFFYLNVVDFQSEDSSTPNKHTPTRARRKPAYQVMLLLLYFKETQKTKQQMHTETLTVESYKVSVSVYKKM